MTTSTATHNPNEIVVIRQSPIFHSGPVWSVGFLTATVDLLRRHVTVQ